jgi:hypothetical protein
MGGGDDHVVGTPYRDYIDGGDGTDYADGYADDDICVNTEAGPC